LGSFLSTARGPGPKFTAFGYRSTEVPLEEPECILGPGESVSRPTRKRARSKNYVSLPCCTFPGFGPISVDRNDPTTHYNGCCKRVLGRTPAVSERACSLIRECALRWCRRYVKPIIARPDFEEWLSTTSYNEVRKADLRKCNEMNRGLPPPKEVRHKVKNFIKLEDYSEYKHARLINSRHDRFKAWCGPFFKKLEEQVYDTRGPIQFIKHVPVADRPSLIDSLPRGMRCFSTDFTAFEKHFTKQIMESCEFILYDYAFQFLSPFEKSILFSTLSGKNKMTSRNGFRACVKARRMSGEMCTSLGNGFTNMILAQCIAEMKNGVIYGYVEGDDGLFVSSVELTSQDYRDLGFEIKIIDEPDPCSASFCGLIFSRSYEIIRDPFDFVAKFGWTSSFIEAKNPLMMSLLRAKALSACYETPQCPIIGAISRYALQYTRGCVARFVDDGYHHFPRDEVAVPPFSPSLDTRRLFAQKYGLSIPIQEEIERLCQTGDFAGASLLLRHNRFQEHYTTRYIVER
jgi:hypothetical protein